MQRTPGAGEHHSIKAIAGSQVPANLEPNKEVRYAN